MLIQYAIHDINDLDDENDRYDVDIDFFDLESLGFAAAECAEDYYDNHDGWRLIGMDIPQKFLDYLLKMKSLETLRYM